MKTSTACFALLLTSIAFLSTGCESNGIANRINEKSASFAALTSEEKQYIEDGLIFTGYTPDMTYMAVGKPDSIEKKEKDGKAIEMWSYKRFYPSGKLETILTDYSRNRNPNLLRSLGIESGSGTVSDHAPSSGGANPLASTGSGSSTGTAGEMGSLSLPDVPVYNLYVIFLDGKIIDLRLESLDGTSF